MHNRILDFECSYCGKCFSRKDGLKRHIDTVHFNIRPYKCNKCDATFKLPENLRYHLKAIHGENAL